MRALRVRTRAGSHSCAYENGPFPEIGEGAVRHTWNDYLMTFVGVATRLWRMGGLSLVTGQW
jgi:hypothetical protein